MQCSMDRTELYQQDLAVAMTCTERDSDVRVSMSRAGDGADGGAPIHERAQDAAHIHPDIPLNIIRSATHHV